MQPGFWLSFSAVAMMGYMLRARLGAWNQWIELLRLHVATSIGLALFVLFFFAKVSIVEVLANLIAVPWITLGVVPLALLARVGSLFFIQTATKKISVGSRKTSRERRKN